MLARLTRSLVPEYRPARPPSRLVAIVVPGSTNPNLSSDDEISLRHLRHFLGPYDKFLLTPRGLGMKVDGLKSLELSPKYFGSVQANGRLLYSRYFYRLFEDYKYIMIYHFDALVFRDEMREWCDTDLDFIGAPWIPCADTPWIKEPAVGNGGFALIKVSTSLRLLHNRYRMSPAKYWEDHLARPIAGFGAIMETLKNRMPSALRSPMTKPVRDKLRRAQRAEINLSNHDRLWVREGARLIPDFKLPDWKSALRFAFEASPRECFELNDRRLPFGCHAWTRYDRDFWEPYLLRE